MVTIIPHLTVQEVINFIPPQNREDKDVLKYLTMFNLRAKDGKGHTWAQYINGNGIIEFNLKNGSSITTVFDDEDFKPTFPLNIDLNVSNRCIEGCAFCYAGCTRDGIKSDLRAFMDSPFFQSLHPGTELAINMNDEGEIDKELCHFLAYCQGRGLIPNVTMHYNFFVKNYEWIREEYYKGRTFKYGLGVSTQEGMDLTLFEGMDRVVFHTIAGITSPALYGELQRRHAKVLILGYKDVGRGVTYSKQQLVDIHEKQDWLQQQLPIWVRNQISGDFTHFGVLSFDNLAIEQLKVKDVIPARLWENFYRGDDGHHTMYIDLPNMSFAKNSLVDHTQHHHLDLNMSVEEIFQRVQNEALKEG